MALILLLAAHLRLAASLDTVVDNPYRADAGDYMSYALNLRLHGVYSQVHPGAGEPVPDSIRSPGYPLMLLPFLDDEMSARMLSHIYLFQALLGVIVVGAVFLIGRTFLPVPWTLLASFLTAISPHLINAGVFVLSEPAFAVLVALLLLAWVHLPGRGMAWVMVCGFLLGLAMLVRPTANLMFPVLAMMLFAHMPRGQALRASGVLLIALALVYAPWPARNVVRFGNTGDNRLMINMLHHGMYPDFTYEGVPESRGFPYEADPRAHEIGSSVHSTVTEIERRFAEEPGRHLRWFLLGKPVSLWSWDDAQGETATFAYPVFRSPYFEREGFRMTYQVSHGLHWPIVILAAFFSVAVWLPGYLRNRKAEAAFAARSCSLLLFYVTALHMIGAPFSRYAVPFRPELFLAACAGAWLLVDIVRNRLHALREAS